MEEKTVPFRASILCLGIMMGATSALMLAGAEAASQLPPDPTSQPSPDPSTTPISPQQNLVQSPTIPPERT